MSRYVLHWGIKSSLVAYLVDVEAEIHVIPPAEREADGFAFPESETSAIAADQNVRQFAGTVRLTAHGGMLDIAIGSPQLRLRGSAGSLDLLDSDGALTVADLTLRDDGQAHEQRWAATLTSAGARLFGGNYPGGTALDPVVLTKLD